MKVLVVDDVALNRELLEDFLQEAGMQTVSAADGVEALEILKKDCVQVILTDVVMPRMDGFALLRYLKQSPEYWDIPVIIISGQNETATEVHSLEQGANDFIHKPFVRQVVVQRVKNAGQLFLHKKSLEELVELQTHELREQTRKIQRNNEKIIDILGTVVEYRNLESGEHIHRVKQFTSLLAASLRELYPEMGVTQEQAEKIVAASPLHDLGKITIPDSIMLKPGRFTPEEFELMKAHTTNGAEMLQRIKGAWDAEYARLCYEICRYHHERYDGKGYPDGLKGDQIPISAQLVSVADVYDALVSRRVYKDAYSPEQAYEMIMSGQCGVFSPWLLQCFRHARAGFEALARQGQEAGRDIAI